MLVYQEESYYKYMFKINNHLLSDYDRKRPFM